MRLEHREVTLLFLRTGPQPRSVHINAQPMRTTPWNVYGFDFDAVTVDLAGEVGVRIA